MTRLSVVAVLAVSLTVPVLAQSADLRITTPFSRRNTILPGTRWCCTSTHATTAPTSHAR